MTVLLVAFPGSTFRSFTPSIVSTIAWKNNKGYPTKKHRQAILENGITKYHRKTFQLVPVQYEIEF